MSCAAPGMKRSRRGIRRSIFIWSGPGDAGFLRLAAQLFQEGAQAAAGMRRELAHAGEFCDFARRHGDNHGVAGVAAGRQRWQHGVDVVFHEHRSASSPRRIGSRYWTAVRACRPARRRRSSSGSTAAAHLGIRGTGLGLPIARELAEAWGGSVRIENRDVGTGARAVIELPAHIPAAGIGEEAR